MEWKSYFYPPIWRTNLVESLKLGILWRLLQIFAFAYLFKSLYDDPETLVHVNEVAAFSNYHVRVGPAHLAATLADEESAVCKDPESLAYAGYGSLEAAMMMKGDLCTHASPGEEFFQDSHEAFIPTWAMYRWVEEARGADCKRLKECCDVSSCFGETEKLVSHYLEEGLGADLECSCIATRGFFIKGAAGVQLGVFSSYSGSPPDRDRKSGNTYPSTGDTEQFVHKPALNREYEPLERRRNDRSPDSSSSAAMLLDQEHNLLDEFPEEHSSRIFDTLQLQSASSTEHYMKIEKGKALELPLEDWLRHATVMGSSEAFYNQRKDNRSVLDAINRNVPPSLSDRTAMYPTYRLSGMELTVHIEFSNKVVHGFSGADDIIAVVKVSMVPQLTFHEENQVIRPLDPWNGKAQYLYQSFTGVRVSIKSEGKLGTQSMALVFAFLSCLAIVFMLPGLIVSTIAHFLLGPASQIFSAKAYKISNYPTASFPLCIKAFVTYMALKKKAKLTKSRGGFSKRELKRLLLDASLLMQPPVEEKVIASVVERLFVFHDREGLGIMSCAKLTDLMLKGELIKMKNASDVYAGTRYDPVSTALASIFLGEMGAKIAKLKLPGMSWNKKPKDSEKDFVDGEKEERKTW
mmetsp:Transcript_59852/g.106414  ORF Transcript_59852/g.106414 Transcript_59852/m.106414 type:complete len:634 (+) Transcript_59852:37-1938(+)